MFHTHVNGKYSVKFLVGTEFGFKPRSLFGKCKFFKNSLG